MHETTPFWVEHHLHLNYLLKMIISSDSCFFLHPYALGLINFYYSSPMVQSRGCLVVAAFIQENDLRNEVVWNFLMILNSFNKARIEILIFSLC